MSRRRFFGTGANWIPFAKRKGPGNNYVKSQGFRTSGYYRIVDWGDGIAQATTNSPDIMVTFPDANENVVSLREDSGYIDYFYTSGIGWTEIDCTAFLETPWNWYFIDEGNLRSFKVNPTTKRIANCFFRNCNLQGVVDFRHVPNISGNVHFIGMAGITRLLFGVPDYSIATTANLMMVSCGNIEGLLDVSMFTEPSGVSIYRLYKVTELRLPVKSTATALTMIDMYALQHFDLRPIKVLSGRQYWYSARAATQLSYTPQAADAPDITELNMGGWSAYQGVIDLTGLVNLRRTSTLVLDNIPGMTNILLPPIYMTSGLVYFYGSMRGTAGTIDLSMVSGTIRRLMIYSCDAANILFHPDVVINGDRYEVGGSMGNLPGDFDHRFGTRVLATVIQMNHSQMNQVGMDRATNQIFDNRAAFDNTVNKSFSCAGGVIPRPTGVYQAPAGYVQGGQDFTPGTTPSPYEKVYVLVNQTNADGSLKYKWTFTTN